MKLVAILAAAIVLVIEVTVAAWLMWGARSSKRPAGQETAESGTEKDDPGAEWRAEVTIEQLSESNSGYDRSRLKVVLRDAKGKELETPDVRFEVNGTELEYRVGQGNYYDRHPYYRLEAESGFRFNPDTAYELTVKKTGGSASPFAVLRTPKPMSKENFSLPDSHPSGRDLTLKWTGLGQQAEVLIYRTLTTTDASGNQTIEAGGPYGDDVLRHRIGAGNFPIPAGSLAIPASYLAPQGSSLVTSITVEISSSGTGKFLHPVLAHSEIKAIRKIVLRADILPPR